MTIPQDDATRLTKESTSLVPHCGDGGRRGLVSGERDPKVATFRCDGGWGPVHTYAVEAREDDSVISLYHGATLLAVEEVIGKVRLGGEGSGTETAVGHFEKMNLFEVQR